MYISCRIQQSHLADLDKNTLSELGVRAIGDQVSIWIYQQSTLENTAFIFNNLKKNIYIYIITYIFISILF